MKQGHIIATLIFIFGTYLTSAQSLDSIDNATIAYERGDYPSAIQFYESTVQAGISNGEIYYNLGNAYYENNDLAHALLNYRRAQQFLPRDLDLNTQLARIRSIRSTLQGETTNWLIRFVEVSDTIFTIKELSLFTFILWSSFFCLLMVYRLKKSWKKRLQLPLIAFLFSMLIMLLLLGTRLYVFHQMPPAIVTALTSPVMSGASIAYFEQYEVFAATEIYITEQQEEWVKFVTADDKQGWIMKKDIEWVFAE